MERTVNIMKEKRSVPDSVKEKIKTFNRLKKQILAVLESGQKTIPEIVSETGLEVDVVTYNLMTLLKYGHVVVGDLDDDDEYYYYELKK